MKNETERLILCQRDVIASVISKRASQCDSQRGSREGERGCADE